METAWRILIHILCAAALAMTAAVLIIRFIRQKNLPTAAEPFSRRRLWLIFAGTAGAAVASRALLLGFCAIFTDSSGIQSLAELWNHWDGPHYMDIARYGYVDDRTTDQWLFIVFFPLYPWLTGLLARTGLTVEVAGMALSWAALAGAAFMLYRLVRLDADAPAARRAVKFLLIFPVTVFLGAQYTESLFLLLSLSCLYALRRRRWWAAGLLGCLAALTRNLGVLLALPFLVEFMTDRGLLGPESRLRWRTLRFRDAAGALWILLIPLGTLVYLGINEAVYGDPLMFMDIQRNHWGQSLDYFPNVLYRTFHYARTDENASTVAYLWAFQTATMALAIGLLPLFVRRLRLSYGVYMVAYIGIAFSASMLLSAARYLMGLAVLYPVLAELTRKRWADWTVTALFAALALIMARGFALYRMVL